MWASFESDGSRIDFNALHEIRHRLYSSIPLTQFQPFFTVSLSLQKPRVCSATQFNQPTPYFACKHIARQHNAHRHSTQPNEKQTKTQSTDHSRSHSSNDKMPSILLCAIKITASVYPTTKTSEPHRCTQSHTSTLAHKSPPPDEWPHFLMCFACTFSL